MKMPLGDRLNEALMRFPQRGKRVKMARLLANIEFALTHPFIQNIRQKDLKSQYPMC